MVREHRPQHAPFLLFRASLVLVALLALWVGCERDENTASSEKTTGSINRKAASKVEPSAEHSRSLPLVQDLHLGESVEGTSDLDGDGVVEHWTALADGGSGFGGVRLEVTTQRGESAVLDTYGSFGEMLDWSPLDPVFSSNPRLLDGALQLLFGGDVERRSFGPGAPAPEVDRP